MEFYFNCEGLLHPNFKGIAILDSSHHRIFMQDKKEKISYIIDQISNLSLKVEIYIYKCIDQS